MWRLEMSIEDISTKVFCIERDTTLTTVYSIDDESLPVDVKCRYLVRLELAEEGHPELTEDLVRLIDVSNYYQCSLTKRRFARTRTQFSEYEHPLRRSLRDGQVIPYSSLIEGGKCPVKRAENVREGDKVDPSVLKEALGFQGILNCKAIVYSEYPGGWGQFQGNFSAKKTYIPGLIETCKEAFSGGHV